MKTSEAVINDKNIDASGLAVKAQSIYNSTNANTNYPSVVAFLGSLQTNINLLKAAIAAGGNTPTPLQTANTYAAKKELKRILKLICAVVNWDANGNEATLLSSGFELKTYTPPNPKTFKAKLGKLSGEIDLEINSYGAAAYVWYSSPDPIGTWVQVDLTTLSKTTIKGLTPGAKLWFKVSVTKGTKVLVTSDPHTIMVV